MNEQKSTFQRAWNRFLSMIVKLAPGAQSFRPFLHRLRGVRILGRAFIGEDVLLETEYPECIEIQDNVTISMRAIVIAHTHGPGKVVLEENCFIGPNVILVCSGGKSLTVGKGAVVSAGSVIMRSVPAKTMVAPPQTRQVATVETPYTTAVSMDHFLAGLRTLATPEDRD